MRAGGTSSSCDSRPVSIGFSATMRMASMARISSVATSSAPSSSAGVLLDVELVQRCGLVPAQPGDVQLAEVAGLGQVDHALLVQLEDGQEADDDVEPLGLAVGEAAERGALDPGQQVDQLDHGVGHAGPDRGDVVEVDLGDRL